MGQKIYQLDLSFVLVNEYSSVSKAVKINKGLDSRAVYNACLNKKEYNGYYWLYENNYFEYQKGNIELHPLEKPTPVLQFSLDGEFIKEYPSQNEAEREIGACQNSISKAVKNPPEKAAGFLWILKNDYHGQKIIHIPSSRQKFQKHPVIQFDLNKNYIRRHDSISMCAKEMGCSGNAIREVCVGRTKTAKGYIWHFEEDCIQLPDGTYQFPESPIQVNIAA